MKKILLILCGFLLVFGMAGQALAYPEYSYTGGFVGGFEKFTNDTGDWREPGATEYPEYPGVSPLDLSSPFIDTEHNVNVLIGLYNSEYSDIYDEVDTSYKPPLPESLNGVTSGTVTWDSMMGYEYLTLKHGSIVDLFYIDGLTSFTFGGEGPDDVLTHAISHYTLWNGRSVPEPANMLLIGTGLLGLVGIGRRRFKK